ncbi:WW domain-containing protein [Ditylenchus destructor]|uniref:WW domain-containing protein n=1 Tax=Ditylenchus destructor TaxID=166010 RepID=A0AAD4RB79_9BILA|nr:WW domain-containing protein [Ditylenchus destructor]
MASKRVELAKQQKLQSHVQINSCVDDQQKSIEELIRVGQRNHELSQHNHQHFQRKSAKAPQSFFSQPIRKSRGSSAGHSREGSSDEGSGAGRHTLSPSASSTGHGNFGTQYGGHTGQGIANQGIVHQRQASAPALINYGMMEQQQQQAHSQQQISTRYDYSNPRARAIPGTSAALPPVAHVYSKSLNTVTLQPHHHPHHGTHHQQGHTPGGVYTGSHALGVGSPADGQLPPQPMAIHQRNVKSCDFDAVGQAGHLSASGGGMTTIAGGFESTPSFFGGQAGGHSQTHHQVHHHMHATGMTGASVPMTTVAGDLATPDNLYHDGRLHHSGAGAYWGDPRAKSQSLDPMTLTATSSTSPSSIHSANSVAGLPRQQQHHQTGGPTPLTTAVSSPESGVADDGLGPLPEGWERNYDASGNSYFIDHHNKTTTWFDPRLSREQQEDEIRVRHSIAAPGSSISAPALGQQFQQQPENMYGNYDPTMAMQHHSTPEYQHTGKIQQLRMERNSMFERQQQLRRAGLLNNQQQQQAYPSANTQQSPHQQQPAFYMGPQHMASPPPAQEYQQHYPNASPTSAYPMLSQIMPCTNQETDEQMDYQSSAPIPSDGNSGHLSQIDPSFVQDLDLNGSDLNPHEFDKYLQIADNRQQHQPQPYSNVMR